MVEAGVGFIVVGLIEGFFVGVVDGVKVGLFVGAFDGALVGFLVGDGDREPIWMNVRLFPIWDVELYDVVPPFPSLPCAPEPQHLIYMLSNTTQVKLPPTPIWVIGRLVPTSTAAILLLIVSAVNPIVPEDPYTVLPNEAEPAHLTSLESST